MSVRFFRAQHHVLVGNVCGKVVFRKILSGEVIILENILLVSSSKKEQETLISTLNAASYSNITASFDASEARRLIYMNEYDLIIINSPLSDEFGHFLATEAIEKTLAGIVFLINGEIENSVSEKMEEYGIVIIKKPIVKQLFYQAVKLVLLSNRRIKNLRNENTDLQMQIEEIRLIDRAKCTLIQYLNMTEEQAHKYLERQAMNMRVSKKKIAQRILNAYES